MSEATHQVERGTLATIAHELREHVRFTLFGTLTGVVIAVVFLTWRVETRWSHRLFQLCHPLHVLLSAVVTAAMYRIHSRRGLLATVLVGYVGSIGIGTLSDCLIPYLGELLLGASHEQVHAHAHIGFIEEWWLVNPAAMVGIAIAWFRPRTKIPHAGHVLLSTWASLFHMLMAITGGVTVLTMVLVPVFLFFAVWLPCCTSDIVFPLLFVRLRRRQEA